MSRFLSTLPAWSLSVRVVLTVLDPLAVAAVIVFVLGISAPVPVAVGMLAVTLAARGAGLEQSKLVLSVIEDMPRLVVVSMLTNIALVALAASVSPTLRPELLRDVQAAVALLTLLTVARVMVYSITNSLRRRGFAAHPVIIVGADDFGARLARTLLANPQIGLVPVGIVDSRTTDNTRLPVPMLGGLQDLERAMINLGVDDVIFSLGSRRDEVMDRIVRRCIQADHQVFVVPRFFELMGNERHSRTNIVHGIPITRLRRWAWRRHVAVQKRAIDLVLATVGVILAAPVMIASAIALRIETGPGVIFSQTRVGQHGKYFTLYKFRTLRPATSSESATSWSVDNDPRLGRVGKFLRRTGLDELPQLFNVLRGDMSVVGPRPERPHFVQEFSKADDRYADRHRVPTGITGWAQVNGLRGDTSIAERVRFDNNYIENWSIWTDLKIMARTLPTFGRSQPAGPDLLSKLISAELALTAAPEIHTPAVAPPQASLAAATSDALIVIAPDGRSRTIRTASPQLA